MNCPYCHTSVGVDDARCPQCGKSMNPSEIPTGMLTEEGAGSAKDGDPGGGTADDKATKSFHVIDSEGKKGQRLSSVPHGVDPSFSLRLFDRFELREKLDSDSLGESYRAYDRELGGEVRLKLFHPHLQSDPLLKRLFSIELKALRRLSHPGILAGYELYDDKQLFFTTELPGGDSLRVILGQGALPLSRISAIFRQLLEIASFIHENGVLHRDIKPDHLYVTGEDVLRVGGFSLVRLADFATVTMRSQMMMLPRYQAPEILMGKAATISSDLYSIGLVLVEMLSGRPFSLEETLIGQLAEKTLTIDDWGRHLKLDLTDELEPYLCRFLPHLLHPDPLERYSSARAVLADTTADHVPQEVSSQAPVLRDEQNASLSIADQCPVCGERIVPKVAICLNCGTSLQRLREWGRGPYLVVANISLQKTKKGKWRKWFSRISVQRLKVMKLLELFYHKLPESGQKSFTRYAVVARKVDRETADHLVQLFEAHGIRARKIGLGKLGDALFGAFLHIPGRVMAGILAGLILLAPFTIFSLVLKSGIAESLLLPQWLLMNFTMFGSMRVIFFAPKSGKLFRFVDKKALAPKTPSELVEIYTSIEDDRLKMKARQLVSETRSLVRYIDEESQNKASSATLQPQKMIGFLEQLEKSALNLLATVPETSSRREAELLDAAQRIETRLAHASTSERAELEQTRNEFFTTLEKLKEAHHFRVKVEEQIASIIERVRNSNREILRGRELRLDTQADTMFDELQILEDENETFKDLAE